MLKLKKIYILKIFLNYPEIKVFIFEIIFRFPKVIYCAVQHFKKYDFDAIFIATNAPGRSPYNRVERRMAPLSKQLSGVILKHDTYGTHLDNGGKTKDEELELKNFSAAGRTLAEIWSEMVIDTYPVVAEFKEPVDSVSEIQNIDAAWYASHVRESQYFLQVCTEVIKFFPKIRQKINYICIISSFICKAIC